MKTTLRDSASMRWLALILLALAEYSPFWFQKWTQDSSSIRQNSL